MSKDSLIKQAGKEKIVYQGKIVEVIELPVVIQGKERTFEIARRSPGIRLIILSKDHKQILISKEHRREVDSYDYRLPGGKVFDSLNEYNTFLESNKAIMSAAKAAAILEAKQEVGLDVHGLTHFTTTKAGATIDWDLLYFVVDDYTDTGVAELELGENIESLWLSLTEVKELALSGKMQEDRSAAVLLRYLHNKTA